MGGEGLEDVPASLTSGGDDGAEGCEVVRGCEGSEGAGDLHFDLHHAQRLLGEVVGEGDGEVGEEAQDVVFELMQSHEEVVPGAALVPAFVGGVSGKARQPAVVGKSEFEEIPIAAVERLCDGRIASIACRPSGGDGVQPMAAAGDAKPSLVEAANACAFRSTQSASVSGQKRTAPNRSATV